MKFNKLIKRELNKKQNDDIIVDEQRPRITDTNPNPVQTILAKSTS